MPGQFSNYGENRIVDKWRGTEPTYAGSWFFALGSVADDATFTEETNAIDLPRTSLARSLANFAGTQAPGSTLASSGTSHTTSNNVDIQWSAAANDLANPVTHVGVFDALTGGNCWAWFPLPGGEQTVNEDDAPVIAAGELVMSLGITGGMSDYHANKLIDEFWRGQAWSYPATTYHGLVTTQPSQSDAGGVEVAGGDYARVSTDSDATTWSSTQGNTSASTGSGGTSGNLAPITFPVPSLAWGDVVGGIERDASSGGNLLWTRSFDNPKTISASGSPPSYAVDKLRHRLD